MPQFSGHVNAALFQEWFALSERTFAYRVKYNVACAVQHGEIFLFVIDHLSGAQRSYQFQVFGAAHRGHFRTKMFCQLNSRRTNSPGSAIDQPMVRSEERRVGKEWVSTGRSRWSP